MNKIFKATCYSALILGFFKVSFAQITLNTQLEGVLASQTYLKKEEQAWCVSGQGIESGSNTARPIIPASVSKLFLTDWALNTLGKDYTFKTEFYYYKHTLYIKGSSDPYLRPRDLEAILLEIQKKDPTVKISKILFTKEFYYNWSNGPIGTTYQLKQFVKNHPEYFTHKVTVSAWSRKVDTRNHIVESHQSPKLIDILKQMNIYSTNSIADILFAKLGGETGFQKFARTAYAGQSVDFGVGSGLDRNYTTCQATITMLKRLHKYSTDTATPLSSFIAVPGSDPGNLTKRFPSGPYTNSFVAKDGYIWGVNSLAGIAETQNGPVYFAFFLGYSKPWHYTGGAQTIEQITNTLLSILPLQKFPYQAKAN